VLKSNLENFILKIKPRPSLFLWTFICIFLVYWLGQELWSGIYMKEMQDLRTGNRLLLDSRPIWFWVVFFLKSLAMVVSLYFLYGVTQMVTLVVKKRIRKKSK
jgi:hypothetical protein